MCNSCTDGNAHKCLTSPYLFLWPAESLSAASDASRQNPSKQSSRASSRLCSPHVEDADKRSSNRSMLIRYCRILWNTSETSSCTHYSVTFCSVITGVGEMNLKSQDHNLENEDVVKPMASEKTCPNCPYLLLDLRDKEEFDCCHIISGMRQNLHVRLSKCISKKKKSSFVINILSHTAQSFPSVMLLRTMNPFTKEILEYVSLP